MNRVIKFRGKSVGSTNWFYGYYLQTKAGEAFIRSTENFETYWVLEETLGQFTGLHDKNGKEVYEGDILRFPPKNDWENNNYSCFEVFFHDGDGNSDYNIGYSMSRMHNHGAICGGYIPAFKPKTVKQMAVIGNIYDNPELLEINK
jgi:uncharacterized phage protein (TIGR01671 family)